MGTTDDDMMFIFDGEPTPEQELEALEQILGLVTLTTDLAQQVLRAAEVSELEAMWRR